MKSLFTDLEFNTAKSRTLLPFECEECSNTFFKSKNIVQKFNAGHHLKLRFCSRKCQYKNKTIQKEVSCNQCFKHFLKQRHRIGVNNFCSQSCAAKFNNSRKKTGTRRSKLETWIEKELTVLYPLLKIDYNKTTAIKAELDIYIPERKLAFELNGIFHYKPIYGNYKFESIKSNDLKKQLLCNSNGIQLIIIDISTQDHFSPKTSKIFLDIIISKMG